MDNDDIKKIMPIGYIFTPLTFPGVVPVGWLPTDGATHYGMDYPLLYGVLREHYPSMTTDTHFTVPTFPGAWIKAR